VQHTNRVCQRLQSQVTEQDSAKHAKAQSAVRAPKSADQELANVRSGVVEKEGQGSRSAVSQVPQESASKADAALIHVRQKLVLVGRSIAREGGILNDLVAAITSLGQEATGVEINS
jgi:hypothetical protein